MIYNIILYGWYVYIGVLLQNVLYSININTCVFIYIVYKNKNIASSFNFTKSIFTISHFVVFIVHIYSNIATALYCLDKYPSILWITSYKPFYTHH